MHSEEEETGVRGGGLAMDGQGPEVSYERGHAEVDNPALYIESLLHWTGPDCTSTDVLYCGLDCRIRSLCVPSELDVAS